MSAYLNSIAESGLLPTGTNRDLLLRAFLLDKAFYELSYELNNRPTGLISRLTGYCASCSLREK